MNNLLYDKLLPHIGHSIVLACYGDTEDPDNISIECEDCNEVLISVDKECNDEQDTE